MKKVIAWLLVLALTAAISIGATLAYLTDTDEDVNVMTLGNVKIDQLEYERIDVGSKDDKAEVQEFHDNKPLYPAVTENGFDYTPGASYVDWEQIGKENYTSPIWDPAKINNEVDKMVFVKNKGSYDAYVRSVFAFEAGNYTTLDQFQKMVHLNLNDTDWTWEWVEAPVAIPNADGSTTTNYFIATATYDKVLTPGALTEISLSQIALDKTATNEDVEAFGETYQVLVKTQGIQADGFDDPKFALDEGFGKVETDLPWENDSPTKGIDVKKALHYYKGGTTKITGNVTKVVFGLNKDYPDIVNSDNGTLVDVEQDVPAYAYYVKNGSAYDVYVLSDSTIYAGSSSKQLFSGMGQLVSVDTDNLDFSRSTSMYEMFYGCGKLPALDANDWDVSNVTNMCAMFDSCKSLKTLEAADWNTGKVKNMSYIFMNCEALNGLDVSDWDVGSVSNFSYSFYGCGKMTALDVSEWDMRSVTTTRSMFVLCSALTGLDVTQWETPNNTNMFQMFFGCSKLKDIDVSDLDVSNVTAMKNVFYGCSALEELDLSKWDVGKAESMEGMFASCSALKRVDMTGWQPSNVTTLYSFFYNCTNLESADVSGWKMPKLTTTSHMFRGCNSATSIDLSDWYTPSLTSVDAMFHTCKALTEIDVSSIDTSKCEEVSQVFEYCTILETIKGLENWDTSSCRTFEECFSGCYALKELDLSGFNTRNVENTMDPMQNGSVGHGYLTMFSDMRSLEKLVLCADFSFDGDGKVTTESYRVILPSPAAKAGHTAMWRNVDTGEVYLASEIPEKTAATYVAHYVPDP